MNYFDHPYISNSDLKKFKRQVNGGVEEPFNLQAIFDLGTLIHQTVLEPHLSVRSSMDEDVKLAQAMRDTFFKDPLCRDFVMANDFMREHECYSSLTVDNMTIQSRCKCDGQRHKMKWILELKGLSMNTEKAFNDAIDRLDYDQGIVHYMLTMGYDLAIIVGISKTRPDRLFKKIVKKHDELYLNGEQKLIDTLRQLHQYSPEDVQIKAMA